MLPFPRNFISLAKAFPSHRSVAPTLPNEHRCVMPQEDSTLKNFCKIGLQVWMLQGKAREKLSLAANQNVAFPRNSISLATEKS